MRRNEQIRISPIRLINENNEQVGILSTQDALRMAQEAGLDLVEVAPKVRPPVCRIMDYGKHKYNLKKKGKKGHEQQLKEVRLRPKTDDHDRAIKVNRAIKFLRKGDKVQFTMRFRGRERAHNEIAYAILRDIASDFGEHVKVERPPSMDGRNMIMIVAPAKGGFDDLDEQGPQSDDKHDKHDEIDENAATNADFDNVPDPATASVTEER
ncbi:MAG: translation initiation factor IF-3 [Planctomycetota bacterium]